MATGLARTLDDRLDRSRIRFVCLALLGVSLVLMVVSFATADRGQTVFGPPLGADFAGFYTAGAILNLPALGDRERLYDVPFQDDRYHQLLPHLKEADKLPYVYPPFLAVAFRPLALLPYPTAVACWLVITAGVYLAGFALIWKSLALGTECDWLTPLLLGLSFQPFVMECWLGGQLSAVGFFWIAAAIALERARRPVASGLALGFCLYKPTLLLLVLPMLLVARRWRTLGGFALMALGLAIVSLLGAGRHNCFAYADVLRGFTQTTTGGSQTLTAGRLELRLWKYVDLNAFFQSLLRSQTVLNWWLMFAVGIVPLVFLIRAWWRLHRSGETCRNLVWAATLTWSLVLNLYVAVYDTILGFLAALLTAAALDRPTERAGPRFPLACRVLMLLLYLTPWITQPLAWLTGFQLFTVVLMAVAGYELTLAGRHEPASDVKEPQGPPGRRLGKLPRIG
jgi:hypothetical protein